MIQEEIAICLVVNNQYFETKFCIENLLEKTKMKVKLYVLDNGSTDERVTNYLVNLCNEKSWHYFTQKTPVKIETCYNILLRAVSESHCCLYPINIFVNNNWLEELSHSLENVPEAGIISIRTGLEKVFFMPIVHNDPQQESCLKNVLFTENNLVNGIMFFKKSVLAKTGLFDENLNAPGFEQSELAFRVSCFAHKNYYIPKHTAIKVNIDNSILFPAKTDVSALTFKNAVESMVKTKQFSK